MEKVVLITGASAGIGRETAKVLAKKGFKVYAAARRTDKLKELVLFNVTPLFVDMADENTMQTAVERIIQAEKRIDVLINCAGYGVYGPLEDVSIQKAREQMEVNVIGPARLIQLVLPKMRDNRYGKIINITSGGGKFSTPYGSWYHSSKFAFEGLSDSLRNEVKQFGIDVIVIEPGSVKSEFSAIAVNSLVENTKTNDYKGAVSRISQSYKAMDKNVSSPSLIAELILKAIEAKSPKTRYAGGFGIKPTLFLRWLLSDKLFDRMLQSQLKY
ncbi:oxidoreductase [Flavobacterium notoginsengisoli]|uniref:oxidoreductase n=1 Tax=Flavobacterium notoginsengisoli TaxID=1478199 RepID=UPI003644A3A5